MENAKNQIEEIVNRETRAWDTKDVALLMTIFHPDMVWPFPRTAQSHDLMDWVKGDMTTTVGKAVGSSSSIPTTCSTTTDK
ncbi:MAG: hypothetical protein JWO20_385 [Candidatus Angelobacter sp.]|nr:hypothetical protein [Candidatus Angelobacter sp.]